MKHLNTKDNEAYAVLSNMRVSPSKANIVLEMIRGKKASEALNILKFSQNHYHRIFLILFFLLLKTFLLSE